MAIVELDLTGLNIDRVSWKGEVLRTKFGGGYGASVLVGPASGLHAWELSSECLPGDDDDIYGPIDGQSRFDYYWQFFKDHTTGDEEIFIIADYRGKKYHVALADPEISADVHTADLYAGGVRVEQRRVVGELYNADGSLDTTPPSVPVLTTISVLGPYSLHVTWTPATDPPGELYGLAGYEVLIDGYAILDAGNVLAFTYPYFGENTLHSFRVRSYDAAPTPNYSDWSNELSATTDAAPADALSYDTDPLTYDGELLIYGETT